MGDAEPGLTAPSEGSATTADAIADELCDALIAFDHVDYNALNPDELRTLLDARDEVESLCLKYRQRPDLSSGERDERGGS